MKAAKTERIERMWLAPAWRGWPYILDQGATSECVSYSTNKMFLAQRVMNLPPMALTAFYNRCRQVDEWAGEGYDGTSVNAGMKIARELGLISGWNWAFELEPVIRHVLEVGPVVMGTDWTREMFMPDRWGYVWPDGPVEGGHAWMIRGVNRQRPNPDGTKGAFRWFQSWGENWGDGGLGWMSFGTVAKLIAGIEWPGEAAAPVELLKPRPERVREILDLAA
jgi:hypothetical protein